MADRGTTVGVIGDAEQSIYGFNGAAPEQFMDFELPGVVDYVIEGNRRSTDRIVEVLNRVRADRVEQRGTRETLGEEVAVVVGDLSALAEHMATITPPPTFLAWRNDTVREFKRALGDSGENLWADFYQADGVRAHFFEGAAAALAYDAGGRPDEAVRALLKAIRPRGGDLRKPLKASEPKDPMQRRALAVDILVALRSVVDTFSSSSLMDVYDWLGGVLDDGPGDVQLTRVNKGKFRTFAEAAPFGELLDSVDISEPVGDIRTIHKAKGVEFDSVLLRLEKPESLNCLLSHAEVKPETRRTVYVGLSRARDKLVVSVDKIEDRLEQELSGAGMSVLRIHEAETGVPTLRQGSLGF
jgi:DNA helicase-2/ATP-dependent DNA helicase PcrA